MSLKNNIVITKLEEITPTSMLFYFSIDWTMEDISIIIECILNAIPAKIVEEIKGADLYCVRIKFEDYQLLLNFEEYGHACWLECVTDQDIEGLAKIKQLLSSG